MYYFPTRDEMMRAICRPGFRICEVGVFLGQFAQTLLTTLPDELVLIDPWAGKVQSGNQDGNNVVVADLDAVYPKIVEHFARWPQVKVVRGYSGPVLEKYPDHHFDVIYIDGDHSLEGATKDLDIAIRKVKPGGWICGHDYDMNELKAKNVYCFGVNQAVDTFLVRHGLKIAALGLDGCVSFAIQVPGK
jgi:hypothetical protein